MRRPSRVSVLAFLALLSVAATCTSRAPEITSERAVAIARTQVPFEPASIETERVTDEGQRVWRVTFRGTPASPDHPLLRPVVIVLIDRRTGEVRSVAKS